MAYYDIDRLRRLPLTTGLLLLTWSAAAVSIVAPANVQILGLPFSIGRPELLPIGLAVAAVYGGLRYYYYAMMLELSPYQRRRDLLDGLWAKGGKKEPRWSTDGRTIIFRFGARWYASNFTPGSTPRVGAPRLLFSGPYENVGGYSHDLFPDGRHLVLRQPGERTARELVVATNTAAALGRRAGRR